MKLVKRIRSVVEWADCRDHCDEEEECEFFRWKVQLNMSLLIFIHIYFQYSKNPRARLCDLMKIDFGKKKGYVSGMKGCIEP